MKKEDQRTKITKEIFRRTLISLLETENLNRISVTELCKRAELSRATFYTYYIDIFDLFEKIENSVYEKLEQFLKEHDSNASRLEKIVEYVGEHNRLFSVLLNVDGSSNFKRSIMKLTRSFAGSDDKSERSNIHDYIEDYAVDGSISVLLHWLQNGKKESPQTISNLLTVLQSYSDKDIENVIKTS
ncbi:TetR/AcrR family transcriptional regulator [Companilactobacillus pabuli]|uniref:TetR/AcrR family transcriptional regulator n=1 Tax=Companilactobacillus pabuli TaxID=2714036 RepID=A0A7L7KW25_9LACO|nr:TetR/AcrR family transcriptional regulator [Companilactobacillus pabuli]AKP03926.1 hypothetical protein ABB45_10060 [Companilactobacillus farciminis]AKS52231.1 hypothetical protein ABB44_10080 [Companilactobacillus farciminis]MDG5113172.1 TetR/AcrR family transcriptional regulator [Companilactobacillus pabuli]QMT84013.1 TetR/AcrR family transcriptional regulator [Companilactobacillus pabuli]GAQ00258.1 TetR family transcriptional regulator [Companilactobacillus farciminis]